MLSILRGAADHPEVSILLHRVRSLTAASPDPRRPLFQSFLIIFTELQIMKLAEYMH